jgi:hypothetical protein
MTRQSREFESGVMPFVRRCSQAHFRTLTVLTSTSAFQGTTISTSSAKFPRILTFGILWQATFGLGSETSVIHCHLTTMGPHDCASQPAATKMTKACGEHAAFRA